MDQRAQYEITLHVLVYQLDETTEEVIIAFFSLFEELSI